MNKEEEKIVNTLVGLLKTIQDENKKFREDVTSQVESINKKTESKHLPVYLEHDILKVAQKSIQESIKSVLTGYGSPLTKLIVQVVDEHSKELKIIISDSFSEVIGMEEFKASIVSAFSHKISRSIISNNDGLFDKVSNELKQDAVFKGKMILAVSEVIEQCLKERKNSHEI